MEAVKGKRSLKRAFAGGVAATMATVLLLSGLTAGLCLWQQSKLMDNPGVLLTIKAILPGGGEQCLEQPLRFGETAGMGMESLPGAVEEYSIEEIEASLEALPAQDRRTYRALGAAMVVLPFLYALGGISLCAWWFYRKKLAPPIEILTQATEKIRARDLDFTIEIPSQDELGSLCAAFEQMRQALWDNNRQLWAMLRQRRQLQASVAHDLRNPIAILEGSVEYLQGGIQRGTLSRARQEEILENLAFTAKRLEGYTDGIRDLNALEELPVNRAPVSLPGLMDRAAESFSLLAAQRGLALVRRGELPACRVLLDETIFYRALENVVANALRFARAEITLEAALAGETLTLGVTDDGKGFSQHILGKKDLLFYTEDTTGEHQDFGLATARLLCRKHQGDLILSNRPLRGACVTMTLHAPPPTE